MNDALLELEDGLPTFVLSYNVEGKSIYFKVVKVEGEEIIKITPKKGESVIDKLLLKYYE